jgi:hypothetical protein
MAQIISIGDTVKVSEDYPVREFAGVEAEVIGMGGTAAVLESDEINGEFAVFIAHLEIPQYYDEEA